MSVNDNVFKNITNISVRQYDVEKRCKEHFFNLQF